MIARHMHVGILGASEMKEILRNNQTGHLGCSADGEVYVVPITYVWTDGWIYGHTKAGKKIDMMRKNSSVCLQVEEVESPRQWKSVVVWGHFEELTGDRAEEAMRLMTQKLGGRMSTLEMDFAALLEGSILYGIKIDKVSGRWEDAGVFRE